MDRVLEIFRTKTIKQSGITFAGVAINGILGLGFYFVLARALGPESFGVFSVAVATLTLIADFSDVGVGTGIVRFVGKFINKDYHKALRILKLSLEIKIIAWLIVFFVGWVLVPNISETILKKPELTTPLRYALIGVGTATLFTFSTYGLQAIQRFWTWSLLNIFSNTLRLLGILGIIYLGVLSISSSLVIYILIPLIGFLIGLIFLPNFFKERREFSETKELFAYNIWIAVFTLIAAITARLDTFFVTRILSLKDVGIYSVAVNLASIVPQVVFALGTVVAPKLSSFDTDKKAVSFLKKLQVFVFGLVVIGLIIGIPLAYLVIPFFYGSSYSASILPFVILLVAQSIFLLSLPAHMSVIYYFVYPKLFVWIALGQLFIVGVLGLPLITHLGIMGAALAILAGDIFGLIIPGIWVLNRFRKAR